MSSCEGKGAGRVALRARALLHAGLVTATGTNWCKRGEREMLTEADLVALLGILNDDVRPLTAPPRPRAGTRVSGPMHTRAKRTAPRPRARGATAQARLSSPAAWQTQPPRSSAGGARGVRVRCV